jgi:pimeloyl-ACP methyl ester carboxylesterase
MRFVRFLIVSVALAICCCSPASANILSETTGWGLKNRGPSEAKGLIYFIKGFGAETSAEWRLVPYFLVSLNADGWDVIIDRIRPGYQPDRTIQWPQRRRLEIAQAVSEAERRISSLKKLGYKKMMGAGHSFGAWTLLEISSRNPSLLDRLILSAPSAHSRPLTNKGERNVLHYELPSDSAARFGRLRIPAFVMMFKGDEYEAPGRADAVKRVTVGNKSIFLVNRPDGFTGHFAAWSPIFDVIHEDCLKAFVQAEEVADNCPRKEINTPDWRSRATFDASLVDPQSSVSSDTLLGKKFVRYGLNEINTFVEVLNKTEMHIRSSEGTTRATWRLVAASDATPSDVCVGRTCERIIALENGRVLLGFDKSGSALRHWWILASPGP